MTGRQLKRCGTTKVCVVSGVCVVSVWCLCGMSSLCRVCVVSSAHVSQQADNKNTNTSTNMSVSLSAPDHSNLAGSYTSIESMRSDTRATRAGCVQASARARPERGQDKTHKTRMQSMHKSRMRQRRSQSRAKENVRTTQNNPRRSQSMATTRPRHGQAHGSGKARR